VSESKLNTPQIVTFTSYFSTSGPSRPIQQATPEQVEALRRLLSSYRAGGAAVGAAPPGEEGPGIHRGSALI